MQYFICLRYKPRSLFVKTVVPNHRYILVKYIFYYLKLKVLRYKKGRIFFIFSFENWDYYLSYRVSVIDKYFMNHEPDFKLVPHTSVLCRTSSGWWFSHFFLQQKFNLHIEIQISWSPPTLLYLTMKMKFK